MVGCDAGVETKGRKPGLKICRHMLYGCTGGVSARTAHKSEASKFCTFFCKSKDEIGEIRDKYFLDHPEAKAEYEKLYGTEAHVIGKKTVTGKISNLILWGVHCYRMQYNMTTCCHTIEYDSIVLFSIVLQNEFL